MYLKIVDVDKICGQVVLCYGQVVLWLYMFDLN